MPQGRPETSGVIASAVAKAKATVQEKGMTVIDDVDMAAFRKAGDKAYEKLGLIEAKNKVHKEMGK